MTYCICCKFIGFFVLFWVTIAFYAFLSLFQVKTDGTVYLEHLGKPVTIRREADNMIPHIKAEDMNGAYYGQGYFHGQTRLFQIQKQRIAVRGKLSETFAAGMIGTD